MPKTTLRQAYFLRDLTERELGRVEALAREETFAADQTIVTTGQAVTRLWVVSSGRVRVTVRLEQGTGRQEEEVLGRIGPGECFGEFSFADGQPACASVVADEATVTLAIPHRDFDLLLDAEPAIARKVLRGLLAQVVGRFRSTDANLVMSRYVLRYV